MNGEVVLITGASAGIGAAAARAFSALGAQVVLVARRPGPLEEVAATLPTASLVVPCDVADLDALEALVAQVRERFGRLDVLVNNAGMHLRGDFDAHDARGFAAMVDVNLRGPLVLTRLCWELLQASPRGRVVNVGSLAGFLPLPHAATYSATKNGLRALSRALHDEWHDRGVEVCLVSPGPVATEFILDDLDQVSDATLAQPMSTADEIAALVVKAALDGGEELAHPARSARLAWLADSFPRLVRLVRPRIEAKGRKVRARLLAQRGPETS